MTKKTAFTKLAKPTHNMRIRLLTHTDADGEIPAIILKLLFKDVTVKHCSNGTMDCDIRTAILGENADDYDMTFITDISCSKDTAHDINEMLFKESDNPRKIVLLDHHPSADYLNKCDWACVEPKIITDSYRARYYNDLANAHSSAASLVYDYFDYIGWFDTVPSFQNNLLQTLVHYVASYDTWDWSDVFGRRYMEMYQIDKLHEMYGDDIFEESFLRKLKTFPAKIFDDTDMTILRAHEARLKRHLSKTDECVLTGRWIIDNTAYDVAYTDNTDFLNETADYLRGKYPDVDLIITNYGTGLSVRTPKSDIDVGKILAKIGGGGHPGAGGCKIKRAEIINSIAASTGTSLLL